MKTVFNNSQLCHVWAQQTQSEGRSGSMFFRDSMIFSYGEHFLAAKIHTVKGKRFAVINSNRYSVTTAKHLTEIRQSLRGLMPVFYASKPDDLKQTDSDLEQNTQNVIKEALKTSKVINFDAVRYSLDSIRYSFDSWNEFRGLQGLSKKTPPKKQLDAVEKHLNARLARYQELNTPEAIAKKEAAKAKRDANKTAKEEAKLAENIAKFRAGERVTLNVRYELLQVVGDMVRTSRGAEVPLVDAMRLYAAIVSGKAKAGDTVGHFSLMSTSNVNEETIVKIGCHEILLSEARAVLGAKMVA